MAVDWLLMLCNAKMNWMVLWYLERKKKWKRRICS